MQDVVGLAGLDPQFVMLRNNMREKIFEYIGRKQSAADWRLRRRLPELARRLEEILFRKFSNMNDYYNMMKGPTEPQLQFAIKTLSAQNQQNQQNQQMSGQATQMNQVGSSGVGGADGLPQHQQTQDAVGLAGLDPHFVMLRNSMREKIFEYIGRKKSSADWRRRLPELARRLEEILFRKFSNKNDYCNMMKGPVEPQLQFAIKTLSAQNQQNQQNQQMSRQIASSSGYGTMIPTPGITQGTSGNSRMPYVTDNTGLSSSGAGMVPQNASMGTSLPGSVSNGYQHLTTSVPLNSTTSSVPSTMGPVGIQRQMTHMIPTPGFNNQQNVPANPDYSNGAGYFNGESAVAPHMQQQKPFPSNQNSHQIQHIGGHSNSGIHSSMLENSSAYGLSDGHVNGGMGLHGSNMQLTNRTAVPEAYMNISPYGSSPKPLQQQFNQHPPQRIPIRLSDPFACTTTKIATDQPQTTPLSAGKQKTPVNTSFSAKIIPTSQHVRRNIFSDRTSTKQITDTENTESQPDKAALSPTRALTNLPYKRSASPPAQFTSDPPTKKTRSSTKKTNE